MFGPAVADLMEGLIPTVILALALLYIFRPPQE